MTAPATTTRTTTPTNTDPPKCLVKLGCWGQVVKCNVAKRGWLNGIGGCPNVGGICIGCTMPGFPDQFMPFMEDPAGGAPSAAITVPGTTIRIPREIAATAADEKHSIRRRGATPDGVPPAEPS